MLAVATSRAESSLSGSAIFERVLEVYATAKTYIDEGEVRTVFFQNEGKRTEVRPFSTAFIRPTDFRFEFKSRRGEVEWDSYIVWMDGGTVKTWWHIQPGIETHKSLGTAIAGATGVSGGSAFTVPNLLMPEIIRGHGIRELTGITLLGEAQLDQTPTFKLQGRDRTGNLHTLWIDTKSFLILQTFEQKQFPGFRTENTTTYFPETNVQIDLKKLQFSPPTAP